MTIGLYLLTPLLRASFVRGAKRTISTGSFWCTPSSCWSSPFPPSPGEPDRRPLCQPALSQFYPGLSAPGLCGGIIWRATIWKAYTLGRLAEGLIYVLGIAGGAFTVLGTSSSPGAGALVVTLYSYLTPNVCAMAVAVFVLFRYVLGLSDEALPAGSGPAGWPDALRRLSLPCDLSGVAAPFWAGHAAHPHGGRRSPPHPGHLSPQLLLSWLIHKSLWWRYLT